MKNNISKLEKLIEFLDNNNMDLISCTCCDGIGIEIDNHDISDRVICNKEDMKKLLESLKENNKDGE